MPRPRKQHRRGSRVTRIESQLAAIAEHIGDNSCSGCFATLTDADSEAGKCTQCGTPIINEKEILWKSNSQTCQSNL